MSSPGEAFSISDAAGLAAIPALVAVNAFFVAAEFGLVTIRRTELEELVQQDVRGAHAARTAVERLDDAIAATQLGITMASLALGWFGETALARLLIPAFATIGLGSGAAHGVAATLSLAFITTIHVVLGELAPKSIALQRPRKVALFVARPLLVFERVFSLPIALMNGIGARIVRLAGVEPVHGSSRAHSVEELRMLVEETRAAGILRHVEAEAVKNIFQLRNKRVEEIMIPLTRVAMVDARWPGQQVLDLARSQNHTRLPVHEGDPRKCIGILSTKDLLRYSTQPETLVVRQLMRSAACVRADAAIGDLLRDLQRYRRQMALVSKEGDEIVGVVTLEDVLEEIVGEIFEERPRGAPDTGRLAPTSTASTVLRFGPATQVMEKLVVEKPALDTKSGEKKPDDPGKPG